MGDTKDGSSAPGAESGMDRVITDVAEKLSKPLHFDPLTLTNRASVLRSKLTSASSTSGSSDEKSIVSFNLSDLLSIPSSHDLSVMSFSERIENVLGEYFTALTVGATLGAAVAAGVALGLMATSNFIATGKYLPSLYKWAIRSRRKEDSLQDTETTNENDTDQRLDPNKETNVSIVGSGDARIVILRGNIRTPRIPVSSVVEQCRECLEGIAVLLSKQQLGWMDVRRLTAYLVTKTCDAKTFRRVLKEYPLSCDNTIVSVLFVQRLEEAYAVVQVEALASKT